LITKPPSIHPLRASHLLPAATRPGHDAPGLASRCSGRPRCKTAPPHRPDSARTGNDESERPRLARPPSGVRYVVCKRAWNSGASKQKLRRPAAIGTSPTAATIHQAPPTTRQLHEHQTRTNSRRSSCRCRHEPNERHVETSLSSRTSRTDTPRVSVEDNHHRGVVIPSSGKDFCPLVEAGSSASSP